VDASSSFSFVIGSSPWDHVVCVWPMTIQILCGKTRGKMLPTTNLNTQTQLTSQENWSTPTDYGRKIGGSYGRKETQ
jgi:hypothetical protein